MVRKRGREMERSGSSAAWLVMVGVVVVMDGCDCGVDGWL